MFHLLSLYDPGERDIKNEDGMRKEREKEWIGGRMGGTSLMYCGLGLTGNDSG